jgi:hypothetical protein
VENVRKEVSNEKSIDDRFDTSEKITAPRTEVPAPIVQGDAPEVVASHLGASANDPDTSDGMEDNDGLEESENLPAPQTVEPVAVMERTFPSAKNSGKDNKSSKDGGLSMNRDSTTRKRSSAFNHIDKNRSMGIEGQQKSAAQRVLIPDGNRQATGATARVQFKAQGNTVSVISYRNNFVFV